MLRLPPLDVLYPKTLREAAAILEEGGPEAALLSGGTDLIPKLKRRQLRLKTLVSLRDVPRLSGLSRRGRDLVIGARTRLSEVASSPLAARFGALAQAAAAAATPAIRNQATVGGNIALDTRCLFYDKTPHWRQSLGFCLKTEPGAPCRAASGSKRCFAVSSGDLAPAFIAHEARVRLQGPSSRRELPLEELYADDGRRPLRKKPSEIVSEVIIGSRLPSSAYLKLRRRAAFDFPALGVAAAVAREGLRVSDCRIVLGGLGSAPVAASEAAAALKGAQPDPELIAAAAEAAARAARPVHNTDFSAGYRRDLARVFTARALSGLLA